MSIVFDKVSITYPHAEAATVKDISFSINQGERVALLGLNGSGKTTILKTIVGLLNYEGHLSFNDREISSTNISEIRKNIGYLFNVPEDQLLFPTVIEDVSFALKNGGHSKKQVYELAKKTLENLGIPDLEDQAIHELSHGQKMRVALAGIVITDPELLLLDEPTAGLDPPAKKMLGQLLLKQNSSMFVATHDIEFARSICNRVLYIDQKTKTVFERSFEEVKKEWDITDC